MTAGDRRHAGLALAAALLLAASASVARAAVPGNGAPLPPSPLPAAEPVPAVPFDWPLTPTAEAVAPAASTSATLLEVPDGTRLEAWLDLPHAFLARQMFGVVNGFDRFFADERDLGTGRSRSFIRLRGETRLSEDGTLDVGSSVRADLSFPYLQKRLKRFRIVLENAGRSLTDTEPTPIAGQEAKGRPDALLRFSLLDTLRSTIDLGAGVLFDFPPGLVGRARFRYARELGRVALGRVAAVGFWNTRDGFGSNGSAALERALARRLLLRWTTATLVSQVSHGFESASELSLLSTLGRSTALTLLGSAAGASKPILVVQTWRVAARLRTSLLRSWIFGEIEPEVRWPRYDADGHRWSPPPGDHRWVPAIFFRLEIQFEEGST
jgi:hypothetical protein